MLGGIFGSMGGVAYSIFAQDETGEGLDAAQQGFIITSDTIIAQIDRVNDRIQEFAKEHAVVTGTAERAALITGIQRDTLEGLAQKYQDVHNSMADITALEVQLGKEHVTNADDMETLIQKYKAFGDANETNAATLLYQMAPAFKQFGVDVRDSPQYMDRLTTMFQTTDLSASMFSSQMARMGPQLAATGISLNDTITILMALNERGVSGKRAMSLMTSALKEVADAGGESGKEMKGLTDEHDALQEKIDGVKQRWGDLNERVDAGLVSSKAYKNEIFGLKQELGHYTTQQAVVDQKMKDLKPSTLGAADAHSVLMKSLGLTGEELSTAGAKLEASAGATERFANAEDMTATGAERTNAAIHQQLTVLGPLADSASAASDGVTKLASAYVLLKGLGVIGGAGGAGGAGGLGGLGGLGMLGPVGAGLSLGLAGVYGLESAGLLGLTGKGAVRSAGEGTMDWLSSEWRATTQGGGMLGRGKSIVINGLTADFSTDARFREWMRRQGGEDMDDSKQRGVPTQSAT